MIKKIVGIAGALAMLVPVAAFASGNLTFLTLDGATNSTVSEGSSVTAKVTYDITSSTDVESFSWELVGSGLPQTCVDTPDRIADGTFTASFDIDTTGASEGTWDVRIRAYGDDGADVSNLCETTDQVDSQSFTDRLTVTDSTSDNQSGGGNGNTGNANQVGSIAWFQAQIAAIAAQIAALKNPPTPAPSTGACAELASAMVGAQMGVYNSANISFQGFLLFKHQQIPALAAGASFGFWGPQTQAALTAFKTQNSCQ